MTCRFQFMMDPCRKTGMLQLSTTMAHCGRKIGQVTCMIVAQLFLTQGDREDRPGVMTVVSHDASFTIYCDTVRCLSYGRVPDTQSAKREVFTCDR
jgi:hypothetical protein